jgi:hypothetical protein
MARAVKVKDYKALCRSGERPVDAWAPFPKSLIVVHQNVDHEGKLYGDFILAHRISGIAIRTWQYHWETKRAALNAARKIARFPEWSKIGRPKTMADKIPGWNKKLVAALRSKIDKALPPLFAD